MLVTLPAGAADKAPLDETTAVRRVCEAGPLIAYARAERLRGQAGVDAADVLPNPSLVLTHQRAINGPVDSETVAGVSVPVSLGGRRFMLQEAARARRQQADATARATLFEAALAFREAYVVAVADLARVQVALDQQTALTKLSDSTRVLAKAGEAAGYDLLRQEAQAKLHRRSLDSFRADAANSQALLASWLGHDVTLPNVPLSGLAVGSGGKDRTAPPLSHPRVQGLEAAAQASTLEARAARRQAVPDLEIFAGYRRTDVVAETAHGVALGLTVPLTFFDHGQGEARQADAQAMIAQASADLVRREQKAAQRAATARLAILDASRAEAEQVSRDVAQLQARAQQLYGAGEASVTELLEAFRIVEEARLGLIALDQESALLRLAIMRAAGSFFDAKLDTTCGGKPGGMR